MATTSRSRWPRSQWPVIISEKFGGEVRPEEAKSTRIRPPRAAGPLYPPPLELKDGS